MEPGISLMHGLTWRKEREKNVVLGWRTIGIGMI